MDRLTVINQVWESLVELEIYIKHGLPTQLETAVSISGREMTQIWETEVAIKNAAPFLSDAAFAACERAFLLAVSELNKFLETLRVVIALRERGESYAEALEASNQQLNIALEKYRSELLNVQNNMKPLLNDSLSSQNISISGPVHGQINVAGRLISSQQLTISIERIVSAIDESSAPESEKAEAKSRLQAFLSHPLVSAIVGGLAGAASG